MFVNQVRLLAHHEVLEEASTAHFDGATTPQAGIRHLVPFKVFEAAAALERSRGHSWTDGLLTETEKKNVRKVRVTCDLTFFSFVKTFNNE